MKVVGCIQARMGSRRLPRKALLPLAGRSVFEWIVLRLRRSRALDGVVLATGCSRANDALARRAERLGVPVVRGPEKDLVARLLSTARLAGADALVRVTGDCPLVDPGLVDKLVGAYRRRPSVDLFTNTFPPSFPDGLDLEILPRRTLERLDRGLRDSLHREWLTAYIMGRPKAFRIVNLASSKDLSGLRWTLDYPEDLCFMRAVFLRLGRRPFGAREVLALLRREPRLARLNAARVDQDVRGGIRSGVYHALARKKRREKP